MPRFVIHDEQGERTVDLDADLVKIGRSQKCHVVVHDQKSSREHCEVRKKDGGFLVVDLKSRNGTTVNGAALTERVLAAGDKIEIGKASIRFEPVSASPAPDVPAAAPPVSAPPPPAQAAPPPAAPSPPGAAKPTSPPKDRSYLVFEEGERKGDWQVLDQLSVTLGRGKSNGIHFSDEKLSAHHAEIVLDVRKGRYYILDHHSTNGTKVNGTKVPEAELTSGAVIELGAQKILFVDPRAGAPMKPVAQVTALAPSEADTDAGVRSRKPLRVAGLVLCLVAAVGGVFFVYKKVVGAGGNGDVVDLGPPQGSLITRNHSFEEAGGAGSTDLVGWTVIEHADGRRSRDAEAPPHGKHALLLHATEPGSVDGEIAVEYAQSFDVERGAVYEAKAWVRTSRCRGLAGIRATWMADGKPVGESYSPLVTGEEEWRVVKAAFLPPRRAKQLRIACVAIGKFGDSAFDEIQLLRRAAAEADRPLVLRLAQWDLEADARGCFSLTPAGESEKGEAVWAGGLALLGEGRRAEQGRLLGERGFPKRSAEGQEARGRLVDLETGKTVPLTATVAVAGERATLSYVAEVPEAVLSARIGLVAALRGTIDALGLDGGAKTLSDGEAAGVTRLDWAAGATPLVLTFKNPVTVRASERQGVTELECLAAEKAATLTVTLSSRSSEEAGEIDGILARAEKAYAAGRPGEALAAFREAISRFPDHESTLATARPRATELEAEAEGELAAVEQAASASPDLALAKSLLSALSKRWPGSEWEARAREAVSAAEAEVVGSTSDAAAREEAEKLVGMGEKALADEKWLLVKVYGKNLVEKFPGTVWETKGNDLIAKGDAGQAAAIARDSWIQETLGRARNFAANGKKDEARAAYEEILAKHPKHPLAAQAAKELAALK